MTTYVETLDTYTPDELIAHGEPATKEVGITGASLIRGAVLGRVGIGTISAPAAGGGNTGDGTFAATPTAGKGAKVGTYTLSVRSAATNGGAFELRDPDGLPAGNGNVGVAFTGPLNFTLQDGATDFAVGDTFTIAVAAGTGLFALSATAAVDGSQVPAAILAEDVDASADDKRGAIYIAGHFNEHALNFGTGHDADTVRAALADAGIHLHKAVG